MKQKKKKSSGRRAGCALLVSMALILQAAQPSWVYAQQDAEGLCSHHPEHTEECGYSAEKGIPCTYTCMECAAEEAKKAEEEAARKAAEEAARKAAEEAAQEAAERARQAIQQVQTLIDALPETDGITAENLGTVKEQLAAIDTAKAGLTEEQQAGLDLTGYTAAAEKVSAVEAEQEEAARKAEEEAARKAAEEAARKAAEEAAQEEAERARQAVQQVQALIDALPDAEGITAETLGTVKEQLAAIDTAKAGLTEEQQASLDLTRYTAAAEKVSAVEAEQAEAARKAEEEAEKAAQEAAERARQAIQQVQTLIDALPETDGITAENLETVKGQLEAIDTAKAGLTEEQQASLDLTGYTAAAEKVSAVEAEQEEAERARQAVQQVQTLIDALPSAEELAAMSMEEQQAVYEQVQAACDAYEELTEEEQAQTDKTKIDVLFEYFNSLTATADASSTQTESSVAVVGNVYYDDLAEALNNAKGQTCDILKDTSLSGTYIFYGLNDSVTINLNGHTISGEFTLVLGGVRRSYLNGPGTIYGNVQLANCNLNAPLTINGNVSQYMLGSQLAVGGSGILYVNGNIGDCDLTSKIADGVTIICTGTCSETDILDRVITQPKNITLSVSPEGSGSVTATGNKVAMDSGNAIASAGSTVTLNAAANQGYRFKEWQVNSGGVTVSNNTFTMPDGDVSITAVFEQLTKTTTQLEISGNGVASYGDSISLEATVTGENSTVNSGAVDFYRGEVSAANKINSESITVSDGTARFEGYQLSDMAWKPGDTPYTIIAAYTPDEGSDFLESSGNATLKIGKATPQAPKAPGGAIWTDEAHVELASVQGDENAYGRIQYGYTTNGKTEVEEYRWRISNSFDGLASGTDYTFYSRYSGNDFYTASAKSTKGLQVTTLPRIITSELDDGALGTPYSQTLSAESWKTVTWSILEGALPAGLSLNGNTGTIGGTPTATADSQNVTIQATISDADGAPVSSTKQLTITIGKGTPTNPEVGEGYDINYEAETVTARDGYELSAANGGDAERSETLNVTPGTDVYVRRKETENYHASNWAEVTIPARPTLKLDITNVFADGFTVTVKGAPTGADLTYRATGTGGYAAYDSGEQTGGTFTGLKAGVSYHISVKCAATGSSFSAEAKATPATNAASFTVSIPRQATAGGNAIAISIDSGKLFDLGADGKVNVKIKDEKNFDNGSLILRREGADNTIMSALSVGGSLFTDLSRNVAVFTKNSKDPVSLSFAAPAGENIPAGNYTGTVNFEISYTQ